MKPSAADTTPVHSQRRGFLSRVFGRSSADKNKNRSKRVIASAVALSLVAGSGVAVPEAAYAKTKAKQSRSASSTHRRAPAVRGPIPTSIVVDVDNNRVLNEFNADTQIYPASTTKMMTLYLVFDALDSGRLRLDQRLTVSANAAAQPRTNLALRAGSTITVDQALRGLMVHSSNDAAVVLGEALGGSRAGFARMMNAKARQLGMNNSNFFNANGLGDPGQHVTARDMSRLMMALWRDHPRLARDYMAIPSFTYNGTTYTNTNRLLGSSTCPGVIGGKTGYIRASGTNIVLMAERNNRRVVVGVFGRSSGAVRNELACNLINFAYFKMVRDPSATYDSNRDYEVVMPPLPTPVPTMTTPSPVLPGTIPPIAPGLPGEAQTTSPLTTTPLGAPTGAITLPQVSTGTNGIQPLFNSSSWQPRTTPESAFYQPVSMRYNLRLNP